jgi:hypothetical protein
MSDGPIKLAYRVDEAAKALSISTDTFERYVRPHIRCVRLGTVPLYPATALQAFLDANAVSPADDLEERRRRARTGS